MTMPIVFAVFGLVLGAMTGSFAGALALAALGYAIGLHIKVKQRLDDIEEALVRRPSEPQPARTPEPRVAPIYQRGDPPFSEPAASAPPPQPQPEPTREPAPPREPARHPAIPLSGPPRAIFEEAPQAPREWQRPPQRSVDAEDFPRIFTWVRDWFLGGNVVVRVGVLVLFIGVGFLLKLAYDHGLMPIELRLAGASLGGAALLIVGWRLRQRVRPYALALQGGGVGLLYMTAFAALRLYDLLPPTLTFALLVAIAGLSAFLAIGQNSPALILLGVTGGFLAPVLASTGQGNHVVLFSYYALLDAGIVAIAWFKAWRPLNLLAFVFTFAIGSAWGVLRYQPENFASTEPFVILFFLMFVAIAVLFALRTAPRITDYVDAPIVFGTPVMTMLLQSALVHDRPYAMAFSALALSAVYLALAGAAWHWWREQLRMLAASFLALGIAFLTLAVPLALDGHWTAATWALEGAAIFWIGMRQQRKLAVVSGVLLQIVAAISYFARYDVSVSDVPLANSRYLGGLLIALGGLATARVLANSRERLGEEFRWVTAVPVYWALTWFLGAGIAEIDHFLSETDRWPAVLGLATFISLGCALLSRWSQWREMQPPALLLLPAMIMAAMATAPNGHVLEGAGAIAWPVGVAAWLWLSRWRELHARTAFEDVLHVATLWFFTGLVSVELWWQVAHARIGDDSWHVVMSALPAIAALAAVLVRTKGPRWPVSSFPVGYTGIGAAGLVAYLFVWTLIANFFDGRARLLPWLPLVNPIELTQGLALAAMAAWILAVRRAALPGWRLPEVTPSLWPAFGLALFAYLTAMLLRALHHYFGVGWQLEALMHSTLVQASLSIFWGLISLGGMVIGTRTRERPIWFAGAALLGIVLLKMVFVDLSSNVARIVSFISVGVLMLIIGWFSPVPPALREREQEAK
jgi:uncharacterized membrane protein